MTGIVKKWLYSVLFLAVIVLLLVGFSPLLIEELVLPPVLARAGLSGYDFSISRLGLTGCSLHIVGRPRFPSPLVSGNVRVDWTPSGLLHRRIAKVSSEGLQVNLVDLAPQQKPFQGEPGHEKSPGEHTKLPIVIDQLEINNGALFFQTRKRIVYLPFTFSAYRAGDPELEDPTGAVNFKLRLQAAEHVFNASISLDQLQGKLSAQLDSKLDLGSLVVMNPDVMPAFEEIGGIGQLEIDAAVQMSPFVLESVEAELVVDNLVVTGNGYNINTLNSLPARVSVSGSGTQLRVIGEGLHVASPLQTSLEFNTSFSTMPNDLQWDGVVDLVPDAVFSLYDNVILKDIQPFQIRHEGSSSDGKISVHLINGQPKGNPGGPVFVIEQNDISAAVEELELDALITYEQHSGVNALAGMLSANGRNLLIKAPQGVVKMPEVTVLATGTIPRDTSRPSIKAQFKVDDASFADDKQNLQVQGLQLKLPVVWPVAGDVEKGDLRVNTIRMDGINLGNFSAEIVQGIQDLKFDGSLQTPLFPDEDIKVSGSVRLPAQQENIAELAFSLLNGNVVSHNFAAVLPAVQGMSGSGNIDVQGNLVISPCGLDGQAAIAFTNGRLSIKETETALENIRFNLTFPTLSSLNTDPKQQLTIGEIRKKKLVVNDVKALFEIESPRSLFIEKISGHWSGGRVFTSSFRLQKGQDELDLAIFCDRLELSSILSQFSLAEAGGEGRLSGRVPLIYTQGRFYVDDGFLFSTPGEKGHLKIRQSKYLETTIPAGVPQFSPLHFAGAALADFEYNWAKLQIKSEEENLLLKLQVDGKPKEKLPFRFDSTKNVFVRLDDESKGGIDQPIKLDVNFNVPVNEIFQYKDNLMPLFRKLN